jgi:CheY-like chemotaxis protein
MRRDDPSGLVLLVEDNRSLSEMVGEYLESKGFGVDYAATAWTGCAWPPTTPTTRSCST